MLTHVLLTLLLMKLLIFASISSLKTLILLKVLQSQNLNSYYVWLKRSLTLYLTVPLGPSLANAFLSSHEKNWLHICPQGFKPVFYRRYVDVIFILFKSNDHFQDFLNSCHVNMSFSMETEKENKLYFLDVEVRREQAKFKTTIYRNPTFSGVY